VSVREKIAEYVRTWESRGYPDGIPDEVPAVLMRENLAPSYKAICLAIMRNDSPLTTLGFTRPESEWYGILKKAEIAKRPDGAAQLAKQRRGKRMPTARPPKPKLANEDTQLVTVHFTAKAWDQVCKYAERFGLTEEQVLDNVSIDYVPLPKVTTKCGLCNVAGHRAKNCPEQIKMPWHPKATKPEAAA
jgi:hypothetical protein